MNFQGVSNKRTVWSSSFASNLTASTIRNFRTTMRKYCQIGQSLGLQHTGFIDSVNDDCDNRVRYSSTAAECRQESHGSSITKWDGLDVSISFFWRNISLVFSLINAQNQEGLSRHRFGYECLLLWRCKSNSLRHLFFFASLRLEPKILVVLTTWHKLNYTKKDIRY